jgi:hypothetical protein
MKQISKGKACLAPTQSVKMNLYEYRNELPNVSVIFGQGTD